MTKPVNYAGYTVLIKEPLGTLCLGLLAIITTIFLTQYNASWRDEMVVVLTGLMFFIFVSSQDGFSLHPRYIIPTLPFAYIWISKLGQSFAKKQYFLATVTTVMVARMLIVKPTLTMKQVFGYLKKYAIE